MSSQPLSTSDDPLRAGLLYKITRPDQAEALRKVRPPTVRSRHMDQTTNQVFSSPARVRNPAGTPPRLPNTLGGSHDDINEEEEMAIESQFAALFAK